MKIIIIDDDVFICSSLKTILEVDQEIEVIGIGHDGSDAIQLYSDLLPDLVLMDIRMKGMDGLSAATCILQKDPTAKILLLTTFSDDEYIIKALSIGAKGYILKQDYASIVPSIKSVFSGQSVYGNDISMKLPTLISGMPATFDVNTYNLSERELDIIQAVAQGMNNKEIANSLFLSEGTVRNYISSVLEKLDLRDRTQLAVFYYKNLLR